MNVSGKTTDTDLHGRVSAVEADVRGIRTDIHEIKGSISDLGRSLGKVGKTDWSVILTVLGSMASLGAFLWFASIAPQAEKIADQKEEIKHVGDVNFQNLSRLQDYKERFIRSEYAQAEMQKQLDEIEHLGSPAIRERLAIMQYRIDHLNEEEKAGARVMP